VTVDGQTLSDQTVTIRDRDTLEQWRVKVEDVGSAIAEKLQ
jgi:glycyl-tRNA synthetase